ncbi:hypothetical protein CHELA40_11433 [Chelatococcus asaccharovorans]|nr:hypothetical protein CHELA40_11433 [Chelatococcus asaccharovorans]CAH1684777.1 hypothetical protein CHELA17_64169 [Chelatococcus asaccharovorans]
MLRVKCALACAIHRDPGILGSDFSAVHVTFHSARSSQHCSVSKGRRRQKDTAKDMTKDMAKGHGARHEAEIEPLYRRA